jgi:hypothetical protein
MLDFTCKIYKDLLEQLIKHDFSFQTISEYLENPGDRTILLRQDVDQRPSNSLTFAQIQHKLGIRSTYYFRMVPQSYDPHIIEQMANLNHEIGYHYEDLPITAKLYGNKHERLFEKALDHFDNNLSNFRRHMDIKTICMHGNPWSKWDSRLLWKYYDYKDWEIHGEPYFDISFEQMLYLTDTGRRWNGHLFSVRDKAGKPVNPDPTAGDRYDAFSGWKVRPLSGSLMNMSEKASAYQDLFNFNSTRGIIKGMSSSSFPERLMITCHPQRWSDKTTDWMGEWVWQNAKNVVKYFIVKMS